VLQIVLGQVIAADSLMKNTWLSDFVRGCLVVVGGLSSYTHLVLGTLGQKAISPNIVKSLDGARPSTQVRAVRGLMFSVLIALVLWQRGLHHRMRGALTPLVALRALMELLATMFFLTALVLLTLASIAAILQVLPLPVTLGAAMIFREPVGWRRWLAIMVGLIGVLIIIRPGTSGFESASLLLVLSVVFAAARDLSTRAMPSALPSLLVTAATAVLVTVTGFTMLLVQGNWVPMSPEQMATLAFAASFLFVGYQCIVLAMRTGEIAYVVPYRYTSLLFSILLGYLFFAEIPDLYTIVGSLIVIAMGIFSLYRELVRARQAARIQ